MALKNLNVVIGADTKGFQKGLKTVQGGITQMKSGLSSLAKSALSLAGVAVGLKAIADSLQAYVGFESSINRVNGLFGEASKYIAYFAENTAKSFGMSESSAYQYAAIYGNLFRGITTSAEENAKVTIAMLKASAVVASKTGRTMEDVMERIRSGLLGNTEAIEDLGINVNVAMLETTDAFKRIADGRSWEQLTFYEQQQIRTLAILEQAHNNFGDEVQQGSAYSLSVLSGAFKDLQATAGAFINRALAPIVGWLTQIVRWATAGLKALAALLGINIKGDLSAAASSMAGGAAGAKDMAGGLDKAGKAAKKAKKEIQGLAGFDEVNTLGNDANKDESEGAGGDSGAGAGAGAGASVFDGLEMPEYGETQGPDLTWVENARAALEPTVTAFKNLWSAMEPFRTFVAQGAVDFYNNFLVPVGKWTFGEGIPRFVNALSSGFSSVNWGAINEGLKNLWSALAPFAINVGEGLLWFWENVLVPLGTWTMNEVVPVFLDILKGAIEILNGAIDALKPLGQWLWDKFLQPIAEWTGGVIADVLDKISDGLKVIGDWVKDNKDTVETMAIIAGSFAVAWGLVNLAIGIWNVIGAIATIVTTGFGAAVALLTSPITLVIIAIGLVIAAVVLLIRHWDDVKAAAQGCWDKIKEAWAVVADWFDTNIIKPLGKFFYGLWDGIKNAASTAWNGIAEIWNKVKGWFNDNVVNPVKTAFSTAWSNISGFASAAWNDTKDAFVKAATWFDENVVDPISKGFKAFFNGILSGFESVVNGLIAGVNFIIGALNKIKIDMPDWIPGIGGKQFGFNLSTVSKISLPRLARGGIVDRPTVAQIGEQGREAVIPLENNTGWIRQLAAEIGTIMLQTSQFGGNSAQHGDIIIQIDGTKLARIMGPYFDRESSRRGRPIIQTV